MKTVTDWTYWTDLVTMKKTKKLFDFREFRDFVLHINEVRKRGTKRELGSNSIDLSNLDDFSLKKDVPQAFKITNKYNGPNNMVFRMKST